MRKMHKNALISVVLFLLILIFSSCEKADLVISSTVIEPFVLEEENRMGLCVYFLTTDESVKLKQMQITDPTGYLTWNLDIKETVFTSVHYKGSSDIVMPENTTLPEGEWKLKVISEDGRVAEQSFTVSLSDL